MGETMRKRPSIRRMVCTAVFSAVLAVLSQLAIPTPLGVPLTLQTFGVSLCGFVLGPMQGTVAVAIYLLLGLVGLPVFTGFAGGLGHLFGVTGGFLWGFPVLAFLCGMGVQCRRWVALTTATVGLLLCHGIGVLQFSLVTARPLMDAVWMSSLPYLWKDVLSLVAAMGLSIPLRRTLRRMEL